MKKSILIVAALCTIVFLISVCSSPPHGKNTEKKLLSAGATEKPNSNYSVTSKKDPGYEEPHNTLIKDPFYKLVPKLDPVVPANLKPHSRFVKTDIEDRPFFDFFAWQTFVGLVWPADPDYRGVPDAKVTPEDFAKYNTTGSEPNRVPVVWETFQNINVALPNPPANGPAPKQPIAWNDDKYTRPFNLDLFSKGHAASGLNEAFSSPLIDQNRQYVRYNLQLNEVMYEFIRQNKWYLKENLPKSPAQASLPPLPVDEKGNVITLVQPQTNTTVKQPVNGNSIELKSSWRVMITEEDTSKPWRKVDDLSRYYISYANIQDPVTGEVIENQPVGLVGLHVVVKTYQFTQGMWCTFEHVDNVKAPPGGRASFNSDGTFQPNGYSYEPKGIYKPGDAVPEEDRMPVEVSRIYKIPNTPVEKSTTLPDGVSTVGMNKTFQKLLAGTVWENYELVMTQWPTDPGSFYPKPILFPRGFDKYAKVPEGQPQAVKDAHARALEQATMAYPRWAGLPIPQVGALNTTMETYFQNPNGKVLEQTSCMGCHYDAADTDFSWALKLRTWPQPYNQGRVDSMDTQKAMYPANTGE